jgi:hypothetical protein
MMKVGALVSVLVVAAGIPRARADEAGKCAHGGRTQTCPDGTVIDACDYCSGGGASVSGGDADYARRRAEEKAMLDRIDEENKARSQRRRIELQRRAANIAGLAAAQTRDWDRAIVYFKAALEKDPSDRVVADNLARAQRELALLSEPIRFPQRADAPAISIKTAYQPSPMRSVRSAPPAPTTAPTTDQPTPENPWRARAHRVLEAAQALAVDQGVEYTAHYVPGLAGAQAALSFVDTFNNATSMVENIAGVLDDAATNTAVMMVGYQTEATPADVLDADKRAGKFVYQFVGQELLGSFWTLAEAWLPPKE